MPQSKEQDSSIIRLFVLISFLVFPFYFIGCSSFSAHPSTSPGIEPSRSINFNKTEIRNLIVKSQQTLDDIRNLRIEKHLIKLRGWVWSANQVLLVVILFLSFGIIFVGWRKQRLDAKRKKNLVRLQKELQGLVKKGSSVSKIKVPKLDPMIGTEEFAEISKGFNIKLPPEVETYLRDYLLFSGRITEIEAQASKARNKWKRMNAITCISYAPTTFTTGILKEALEDRDPDISYSAMLSLGRMKTQESAEILLVFLEKHKFSGQRIVSILENFPPAIGHDVLQVTEHPDATVRFWALKLLSKLKPVNDWRLIAKLTDDESPNVRSAACECLGNLENKETKPILLKSLHDPVWFVRMQAVRSLSKICGAECTLELIELLVKDPSTLVKESVKNAILNDIQKALPYIEQCLNGHDVEAKKYCVDALIDSNYVHEILTQAVSDDAQISRSAIRLLKGLVKSQYYFGLKKSLDVFKPASREKMLKLIAQMDANLAGKITAETERISR